jgi:hypothetical protein
VIAIDTGSGEERWRKPISERSEQWAGVRAFPHIVLVTSYASSSTEPRPFFVLDPASGRELWQRPVHGDDRIYVFDDVLVVADNENDRLQGFDVRTGKGRWTRENPKDEYGYTDASVYAALTAEDLAGPATSGGGPLGTTGDDEHRLVQIGSDRKARVIDARSGDVLSERGNVGDPTGNYLAYGGRLFVAGTSGGYQIVAYDLTAMGEPRSLYRAPDESRTLDELEPCGEERLCVLDGTSSSDATEVASIDVVKSGQVWRHKAPAAEDIVPVGDRVLVRRGTGETSWVLRDAEGKELASREGTAVRLDGGNVLSFTGSFGTSSADLSVAGVGAVSGEVTELGPLPEARGESCSWNSKVVVCMTDTEFVLWRIAAN